VQLILSIGFFGANDMTVQICIASSCTLCLVGRPNKSALDPVSRRFSKACAAGPFIAEQMPSNSDIIFDCIRVTWVAMIICILFFEMNLASALWTGIITGLAYTLFVRAMYQSQLDVLHREQAMRQGRLQAPGVQTTADGASPVSPLNTQPQQQQQQQHPYVIVV